MPNLFQRFIPPGAPADKKENGTKRRPLRRKFRRSGFMHESCGTRPHAEARNHFTRIFSTREP